MVNMNFEGRREKREKKKERKKKNTIGDKPS
jgi:hypothetical protein